MIPACFIREAAEGKRDNRMCSFVMGKDTTILYTDIDFGDIRRGQLVTSLTLFPASIALQFLAWYCLG